MPEANATAELAEAQRHIAALEQELEQARQQQEMLLHTLSHDLRTPVMTILGFTDMLLADLKDTPEDQAAHQYLEHIRNSASRQASLIESLLNLTRMSRQTLRPEPVDLTRIAFDYWQEQPELVDDKRISVKLLPTPPVVGDKQLLTLVIQALLHNAHKFTRKIAHPEISFGAEQTDDVITYYVRDNGVGFNAERAERLFQPFRRLHSGKDYDGLGIGLATTAMIIQKHQGRLWAESVVDKGTTMRFTLGAP
ncbi:MAG: ATP-binding protein [Steroidobacteraceae bacterium]